MIQVDPREYELEFFKENGFVRKQCVKCGRYFWTVDPDRTVCGDSPCVEYEFIGNPPTRRRYTIAEMREEFLSFFEKHGHTRMKRYPVVARWREDIFLTIASIACFQPHVTSGEVPPPYNPLVISQPCIRLTDVDNVGRTGGRHLTIFEMMAHHAFSSKDRWIYWKDETVRYHHELMTERLGIPSEEISYIEHWWEGGGDAGPDVEGVVRGLEVSTLVFMQYRKVNGKYVELPLKIVDTGYGLERYTWLSTGTASAFETIYGSLVDRFLKYAGVQKPEDHILREVFKFSGLMNVEDPETARKARGEAARRLGLGLLQLEQLLAPIEKAYAVLDHTKAILFMLGDGIVPSNAKAGYLARFLIRRALRLMDEVGFTKSLADLIEEQLHYWSGQFPEFVDSREIILEIAELEERKYRTLLTQGKSFIQRLAKDYLAKGVASLPLEKLVELYDSHGLPPTFVKSVAEETGLKVDIPPSFDSLVAERHSSSQRLAEERPDFEWVRGLPETKALYYEDPDLGEFKAKVIYINGSYVVLDQTAFYPEGGGQLPDTGVIVGELGEAKVLDVQRYLGVVVHKVDKPIFKVGEVVKGKVNLEQRKHLSRHHTATHILLGAARRVLGEHVWQEGAQKEVEKARLDVSHYKRLTRDEIRRIEELANRVVMSNLPVHTFFEDRNAAEQRYGFRLYQGGVVPGRLLRIVEIPGWDVEACGGIHCKTTGEVGLIKILRTERIQDGVERLEFAAGEMALRDIWRLEGMVEEVAAKLEVPVSQTPKAIERLSSELRELRRKVEKLRSQLSKAEIAKLKSLAVPAGKFSLYHDLVEGADVDDLIAIASQLAEEDPRSVVLLFTVKGEKPLFVVIAGREVLNSGIDGAKLAKVIADSLEGRGGGKRDIGQGVGKSREFIPEAVNAVKKLLESQA